MQKVEVTHDTASEKLLNVVDVGVLGVTVQFAAVTCAGTAACAGSLSSAGRPTQVKTTQVTNPLMATRM
jgi:hypothetical protein